MRLKNLLAIAFLAVAACSPAKQEQLKAPDSVDRMSKNEVEAIVREYLLKEPEILVDAFHELDRKRAEADFKAIIASNDDPTIGAKDAPITVVEFFDYNCPYCHQANEWLFKQVDDKRGGIRVIFKEFPILRDSSHMAALAALSADRQGKYREMHVALMKSRAISAPDATGMKEDLTKTQAEIDRIAKSIGLDVGKLHKDMEDAALEAKIRRVHDEAETAGINGTPRFYINGATLEAGFSEQGLDDILKTAREAAKKS